MLKESTLAHMLSTCERALSKEESRNQAGQLEELNDVTPTSKGKEVPEKPWLQTLFGVSDVLLILSWGIIGLGYVEIRKLKAQ